MLLAPCHLLLPEAIHSRARASQEDSARPSGLPFSLELESGLRCDNSKLPFQGLAADLRHMLNGTFSCSLVVFVVEMNCLLQWALRGRMMGCLVRRCR